MLPAGVSLQDAARSPVGVGVTDQGLAYPGPTGQGKLSPLIKRRGDGYPKGLSGLNRLKNRAKMAF